MKILAKIPLPILFFLFALGHISEAASNVSLPNIAEYFKVSGNMTQITSAVSFFGYAVGIFCLGRISDLFGRKPVVILGLFFYIFSSIAVALSGSVQTIIILKFFSSFGASVGSVIAQAMARDSYKGSELSYVYATMFVLLSFVPFSGATIGGYIVEYSGWRNVFVFLTLLALAVAIVCYKYLPETNPYIGNVGVTGKYFSILKVVMKDKKVLAYAFLVGAINGATFGFYVEAPFIFIDTIGLEPSTYGKLIFSMACASAFASLLNRYWMKKMVNENSIVIRGLVLILIAAVLMNIAAPFIVKNMEPYKAVLMIFLPMIIHIIGHSFVIPTCLRHALEDYFKVTGSAGSIFGFLYYLIVSVFSLIISKVHSDTITKFAFLYLVSALACIMVFRIIYKFNLVTKNLAE